MDGTSLPPGTLVADRYRPVGRLGVGGMSIVIEAVDERLARPVALKLVSTTDPDEGRRLRSEALALARLRHPTIVQVYDVGEHDERPYIVTELVRGEPLHALLRREGPMGAAPVAQLGADLADGLDCAHHAGVVHRDLKPGNVLVEPTGRARLIDFGIATGEHAAAVTHTGMVVGTPAYLAPEQVDGGRATPASDVYSLGLVLIEALTGVPAFEGSTSEALAARLVRGPALPSGLDRRWTWLLGAMTRRDPEQRPAAGAISSLLTAMAAEPLVADLDDPRGSAVVGPIPRVTTAADTGPGVGATLGRRAPAPSSSGLPHGADRPSRGVRRHGRRRRRRTGVLVAAAVTLATAFASFTVLAGADGGQEPAIADPTSTTSAPAPAEAVAVAIDAQPASTAPATVTTTTAAPRAVEVAPPPTRPEPVEPGGRAADDRPDRARGPDRDDSDGADREAPAGRDRGRGATPGADAGGEPPDDEREPDLGETREEDRPSGRERGAGTSEPSSLA